MFRCWSKRLRDLWSLSFVNHNKYPLSLLRTHALRWCLQWVEVICDVYNGLSIISSRCSKSTSSIQLLLIWFVISHLPRLISSQALRKAELLLWWERGPACSQPGGLGIVSARTIKYSTGTYQELRAWSSGRQHMDWELLNVWGYIFALKMLRGLEFQS